MRATNPCPGCHRRVAGRATKHAIIVVDPGVEVEERVGGAEPEGERVARSGQQAVGFTKKH
jgi:hypothetical protein